MLNMKPGEIKTLLHKNIPSVFKLRSALDEFEEYANCADSMLLCETARHCDDKPHPFFEMDLVAECQTDGCVAYTVVMYA